MYVIYWINLGKPLTKLFLDLRYHKQVLLLLIFQEATHVNVRFFLETDEVKNVKNKLYVHIIHELSENINNHIQTHAAMT